jgi:hypothetical protein
VAEKGGAEKFQRTEGCTGKSFCPQSFCPHMGLSESAFENALMLEVRQILGVK